MTGSELALLLVLFGWIKYDIAEIRKSLSVVDNCGFCQSVKKEKSYV